MWFAGLPAAFCGWMLEAIKHAGDNPPALNGAGYNLARTAAAGIYGIFDTVCHFFSGSFLMSRSFFYSWPTLINIAEELHIPSCENSRFPV